MEGVPNNFLLPSKTIGSYDSFDLAAGIGYKRFYPVMCQINGSTLKYLSAQIVDGYPSKSITTGGNAITNSAYTAQEDHDFDLTIIRPMIIADGSMFVNLSFDLTRTTTDAYGYVVVNVYHVTATGTETQIGTVQGAERVSTAATGGICTREALQITLTKKYFSAGAKLRVNVQLYLKTATAATYVLYYDPSNRISTTNNGVYTGAAEDTNIIVDVPFKVNL